MSEKIAEIADELFKVSQDIKELQKQDKILREQLLKYLDKTETKKFTSDEYIMELTHRLTYDYPSPEKLTEIMGEKFAKLYLVVDRKVRNDLPPAIQSEICPISKDTTYVEVRVRVKKNGSDTDSQSETS